MADFEFERLVEEGMAALERSRERLQKDRDKPIPWEKITPEPLKPAVKHIREEFGRVEWQLGEQTECGCYFSLHPELVTLPKHKGRQNLVPTDARDTWHLQFEGMTESQRFGYWIQQYAKFLKHNTATPFNSFLTIGLAQKSQLSLPAVEWAKSLTRELLYSLRWTVPHLIKRMCDEQEDRFEINKFEINSVNFDAHCAWVYWRAPRFIHMEPVGNTPYNEASAWQREDNAEKTELLLRGLTAKMLDPAWFGLDRLAGEAYVSLASVLTSPPPQNQDGSSSFSPEKVISSKATKVPLSAPTKQDELPAKKADLSQYLDQAKLTDRQRKCISLKYEYELTVTQIAEHLGLSRATVDEHIAAANRKLQLTKIKDRLRAKKSRFNPEE